MTTNNIPFIKLGIIAASRNNFADELSISSRECVMKTLLARSFPAVECKTLVVTESDAIRALHEATVAGCNALLVLLGNFGPETPETIIAKRFDGPVMYMAVSEVSAASMYDSRRDSYCGLLNCSYNLALRNCSNYYLPKWPIGTPDEIADAAIRFCRIATAVVALKRLKIVVFGPRPSDFLACNAPLKPLYNLNIEVQENSEMDLLVAFKEHKDDPRIEDIVSDMKSSVGNRYPDLLPRMAQYELTLRDWVKSAKGASDYVILANKCWPAFQKEFGFLPCFVHSRLAADGIPVGCETDIYGALSEYIGLCVSGISPAILDINNNIPHDMYVEQIKDKYTYRERELFIGFHCGNTPAELLCSSNLRYKMNRKTPYAPETGEEQTRGTLEGPMIPGDASCFRLHASPEGTLQAYIAKGEILPITINTYGCWALFGVHEMDRFYRYVLLEKHFPHHSAIVYGNHSADLYDVMQLLGIPYIGYNQAATERYINENPFI